GVKTRLPPFFSTAIPMPRLGRSRTWPIEARTSKSFPRNFPIVRAFAGDSTMTSAGPVGLLLAFVVFPPSDSVATAPASPDAAASFFAFLPAMKRGILAGRDAAGSRNGNTLHLVPKDGPKDRKASRRLARTARYPASVTAWDLKPRTVGELLDAA